MLYLCPLSPQLDHSPCWISALLRRRASAEWSRSPLMMPTGSTERAFWTQKITHSWADAKVIKYCPLSCSLVREQKKVFVLLDFIDAGYSMHFNTMAGKPQESGLLESRTLYPKRKLQCLQFFYKMTGSLKDKLVIWVKMDDGTGTIRRMKKIHTFFGTV